MVELGFLSPQPSEISADILNKAIQIACSHFKSQALAHRIGGQFEQIIKFMNSNRLLTSPVYWKNPLKRPSDTVKVGKKADADRLSKMPSAAALDALPSVFQLAREPSEIIVSSTAAILFCAPNRIHEVLQLPTLCEDESTYGKDKKKTYSLRWWPGKGAKPMLKPVLPTTVGIVKEALAKIRLVTDEARKVAKWYSQYPDMIYLDEQNSALRQKVFLTLEEAMDVLGLPQKSAVAEWCKARKIIDTPENTVPFKKLEHAVLQLLPLNFPLFSPKYDLKYSDALFVVLKNQLHSTRHTIKCAIEPININTINYGLGSRVPHGAPSIFTRLGLSELDGSPIIIHSHQFRHYLNTLSQLGGLSQLDTAKWSGRTSIAQNVVYDHVTTDQALAIVRDAIGDESKFYGPLGKLVPNLPLSRDEFASLKIQTAHTTDIGFCINDFAMTPCDAYRDCLFCRNLVCIKSDAEKRACIKFRLEEAKGLLLKAEEGIQDEYYGSDRWLEHHRAVVARLTELHSMMEDENIHDTAVIQLAPPVKKKIINTPRALI